MICSRAEDGMNVNVLLLLDLNIVCMCFPINYLIFVEKIRVYVIYSLYLVSDLQCHMLEVKIILQSFAL